MERIDADGQARLFFDRMTIDLESMVKRPDVDSIVKDGTQTQIGNDSMAFFAKASGYFPTSPDPAPRKMLSLLAYRVNGQTYQLERLAKGLGWNTNSSATQMVFLPTSPPPPGMLIYNTWSSVAGLASGVPNLNLGTDTDYQVMADSIFRLEYCYVLRDGSLSNVPYLSTNTALNGW